MKRGFVNSMVALSLLLLAATVVLWVSSYWLHPNMGWYRVSDAEVSHYRSVAVGLTAIDGKLTVSYSRLEKTLPESEASTSIVPGTHFIWRRTYPVQGWVWPAVNRFGFGSAHHEGIYGGQIEVGGDWTVPAWLPALLFATPPVLWFRFRRRMHNRRASGQCGTCGYDLRASPQRCPECGEEVTHSAPGA
jgi:hypothetical protein